MCAFLEVIELSFYYHSNNYTSVFCFLICSEKLLYFLSVSCCFPHSPPCNHCLFSVWKAYTYLWLIFSPSKSILSSMAREYWHTADRKNTSPHWHSPWFLVHTLTLQTLPSWISPAAMLTSDFFWLWFPWGTVFECAWSLWHSLSTTINFVLRTPDHVHVLTPFDSSLYTFFSVCTDKTSSRRPHIFLQLNS